MKLFRKWLIWIGGILLVISIIFNVVLTKQNLNHKNTMREALARGVAFYRTANDELKLGSIQRAFFNDGNGFAEMNIASNNLSNQHNHITQLNQFLQQSIYNRANKKYSPQRIAQENHIFNVMVKTFKPLLSHPNSVSNKELSNDFKKVFNAMTLAQMQTMRG